MMHRVVSLGTGLIALWFAVSITSAHAHDWYPIECCHSRDCAPVTDVTNVAGASYDATGKPIGNALPMMVVTTKIGTAVVPPDLPRRMSPDNQMHACMLNMPLGRRVICIFMPPEM
jgi:hypothetical protein